MKTVFVKDTLLMTFTNVTFLYFAQHNSNSIQLFCIRIVIEVSKLGRIKPKLLLEKLERN